MIEAQHTISLLGYGEAGGILGAELAATKNCVVHCFDIKFDETSKRQTIQDKARRDGIIPCDDLVTALAASKFLISAVTATSSLAVARASAPHLTKDHIFLDLNSVSPTTKCEAQALIEGSGAAYIDVAVMAPVPASRLKVPLLIGGCRAEETAKWLVMLGMNVRVVAEEVGVASAIKMCRSVIIKGLEALTLECLGTARHYGAEHEVIASLQCSFPGMGWDAKLPSYLISRIAEHGARRSAEMQEVAKTVTGAGVAPRMSLAAAQTQSNLVEIMLRQGLKYTAFQPFEWEHLLDALDSSPPQ